jgi:hypothetical protein
MRTGFFLDANIRKWCKSQTDSPWVLPFELLVRLGGASAMIKRALAQNSCTRTQEQNSQPEAVGANAVCDGFVTNTVKNKTKPPVSVVLFFRCQRHRIAPTQIKHWPTNAVWGLIHPNPVVWGMPMEIYPHLAAPGPLQLHLSAHSPLNGCFVVYI